MNSKSISLEDFLKQPWSLRVSTRGTHTYILNQDLRLSAKGAHLEEAHRQLQLKMRDYWQDMNELELTAELPLPATGQRFRQWIRDNLAFWGRHLVLGVFYILIFLIGLSAVVKQFDKTATRVASEWSKSTQDPTTPEGAKRLEKFKRDLEHLKPYIQEIQQVWNGTPEKK